MPGNKLDRSMIYLKIIGGNIVQEVPEGTPEARRRDYETSDGKTGTKFELVYSNWTGRISDIRFIITEFGEQCNVVMEDAVLSMNTTGRYFKDFACKVFNADLEQAVTLHPYDMETDSGRKMGVSFQQGGEKLKNFFYDGEKNLHGFPEVDKAQADKKPKTYWKIYFAEVEEFLIEKLKELKLPEPPKKTPITDEEVEEIFSKNDSTDDLPF